LTKDDVIVSYECITGKSDMPEEVWQKFLSVKPHRFIGQLLFDHGLDPIGDILTEHCGVKPDSTLNSQETESTQLSSMKYDEWTWNDEEGTEKPAKCKCGVTFKTDTPLCPICCAKEFKWNEDMMISARLFKK